MRDQVMAITDITSEKTKLICGCIKCNQSFTFDVNTEKYQKWMNRELAVQHAFPEIPKEQRELLISGICPKCWEETFGSMEWMK